MSIKGEIHAIVYLSRTWRSIENEDNEGKGAKRGIKGVHPGHVPGKKGQSRLSPRFRLCSSPV